MPRPRLWRAPSTFSTRITPVTAARAIAARGSRQFERTAAFVQRQASRRLPVAADQQASCPYTRAAPVPFREISGWRAIIQRSDAILDAYSYANCDVRPHST